MSKEAIKATVNGQFEFPDLDASQLDIITEGDRHFHILNGDKAYRAEVVAHDMVAKTFHVKVNGSTYQVKLSDHYDQLIKKLGLAKQSQHKVKDIKAPMPGLVLGVNVEAGQAVKKGDALLILEAMKMENVIKSPGDGVVKNIPVAKGQPVEKGFVLIEME